MNTVVIRLPDEALFWLRFICLGLGVCVNVLLSHMGFLLALVMLWSLCEQALALQWRRVDADEAHEKDEQSSQALGMRVNRLAPSDIAEVWSAYPFVALRIQGQVVWFFGVMPLGLTPSAHAANNA